MYVICPNCKYPELIMSPEGKKGLKSICKSCGNSNVHDAQHKAGKIILAQLQKGKPLGGDIQKDDIKNENDMGPTTGGMGIVDDDMGEKKKKKKEKKEDISDLDTDLTLESRRLNNVITHLNKVMKDETDITSKEIYDFLMDYKMRYQLTDESLHLIALCGVFGPSKNIVKHWDTYEELFLSLVKLDGKLGLEHFMQSVVLYFIKQYNEELGKFGPTFMKKMLDNNLIGETFILEWYDQTKRLDKESMLYSKKSERKFREMLVDFIEWMKNAETEDAETTADESTVRNGTTAGDDDDDDD